MVAQNTRVVRWGVLGTANIARLVIPAIQQSHNGRVVAIASRDLARAKTFAAELSVPRAVASYDELLNDPEIDAVYIPLPNSLHKPWTIRAAQQGKHVLCEKPLALTASECDEMIEACDAARIILMEAFMYRFHPQIHKVRGLIAQGSIGKVRLIRAAFSYILADPGDIRRVKELGGGALMDVGCYCVNMARLMIGTEPAEVQAMADFGTGSAVDETFVGLMRFPGGELALFDCSFGYPFRQFVEIVGTEGVIEMPAPWHPGTADASILLKHNNQVETVTVPGATHYTLMAEHFAESILRGTPLCWPASDDRANMAIIDALYCAARSKRVVSLAAENG